MGHFWCQDKLTLRWALKKHNSCQKLSEIAKNGYSVISVELAKFEMACLKKQLKKPPPLPVSEFLCAPMIASQGVPLCFIVDPMRLLPEVLMSLRLYSRMFTVQTYRTTKTRYLQSSINSLDRHFNHFLDRFLSFF